MKILNEQCTVLRSINYIQTTGLTADEPPDYGVLILAC